MTAPPANPGPSFPIAAGQKALWFLHRVAPESAAYTIAGAGRFDGPVDPSLLRRSFGLLMERHASLRTSFPVEDGDPVQRVGVPDPGFYEEVDASGWSEGELPERVADLVFRPFDLERGPAFRVFFAPGAPAGPVLALSLHHVVGDLWSLAVLLREVGQAYDALARGGDPASVLEPLPLSYGELVTRQATALAGEEGARLRRFWLERLDGGVPALDLPTDRPRPRTQSFEGAVASRRLGPARDGRSLRVALGAVARGRGTTRFAALMAGFQALLGRYAGQEAFAVGTPTSGRRRFPGATPAETAGVVGYLVNPVPIRADLAGGPSFGDLVERVGEEVDAALEHQGYPLTLLAEELEPAADRSRPALFQTLLVLQKSPIPGMRELPAFALGRRGTRLRLGSLEIESIGLPQRGSQFDLSLFVTEEDGELVGSLEYDTALFEVATAERMLGHLATLLQAAAADPDRRVSELPILTTGERRQLLGEWAAGGDPGATETEGLRLRPLHELVAAQAERTPSATALVAGEERVSYRDLVARARRVGAQLRNTLAAEPEPEPAVGVFLHRGPDLVTALLGVLEAGAAYVPMDPAYPPERIALMVEDGRMPVIVTEDALRDRLRGLPAGARVVTVSEASAAGGSVSSPEPGPEVGPEVGATVALDRLAYVIYTSGSTGRPKGVAISHRSAAAMVRWAGGAFDREELSGVLFSTSVCFDLSVFELFVPLAYGGTVILAEDALALPGLPAAAEVTLVNTVPSAMAGLVRAGALPDSVRTVSLAGEPLRRELVDAVYGAGPVRRVVNLYGPSEDTTYSTGAECPPGEDREPTIGRALRGGRGHVADRGLRLLPTGVPGELLLGGVGLARGYLGRPALTAERFVPDPFGPEAPGGGEEGGRLYRTGDRVRHLPDGRLEFLGRLDHQVKVRGFRIELGEVELALRAHPAVAEAVVVARGEGADRSLAAYLVSEGGPEAEPPTVGELRAFLGTRLPEYMTPTTFVVLESLPLTPNGKVDRAALPEPGGERPALEREYVAPETDVERVLADLWSRELGVERIGIHDSFFELGGHSLKATKVLLRVRELFGVDVPVHRLFERPTIAGLAAAIGDEMMARLAEDDLADVLADLGTGA